MTAKAYLQQARHLDNRIECRIHELESWRELSGRISGSNFEAHYNPNKPTTAPFTRCIEKIIDLERDIDKLIDLKYDISSAIERMDNHEQQLLLKYRYFDGITWREIGTMMNISERTARRLHDTALKNFFEKNKCCPQMPFLSSCN